jgi:hypothetical protein
MAGALGLGHSSPTAAIASRTPDGSAALYGVDATCIPGDDSSVNRLYALLVVLFLAGLPAASRGQDLSMPGDNLHVYLMTLGPGDAPWEKFGHDFLDIEDPQITGPYHAIAYNWGVFDFGTGVSGFTSFAVHFIQGKLIYSMRATYTDEVVNFCLKNNRYLLKQELRLTPAQKVDLVERLEANDTDEKRFYLYDYFLKNCSTMTRDAIDQTVDGRVHATLSKIPAGTTYRWQFLRCTADVPWLYVFLDYSLGQSVDRPLSDWEDSFLPGQLADHLNLVQVPGPDGKLGPLIQSQQLLCAGAGVQRSAPPGWYLYVFLATGIGYGAVLCLLAMAGRFKLARWSFALLGILWSLLAGLLGGLMTFAYFTDHQAAKWNENWFQGNVLSLLLVVLIPASRWWPRAARTVAFVVLGLSLLDLLAKATPWFWQRNGSIIAAALPIHIAIAWGLVRLTRNSKIAVVKPASVAPEQA